MAEVDIATQAHEELGFSRWWQIVAAVVMMALVSPYQYVWSSIQEPLANDLGVSLPALGAVFTLYVIFQSGTQFPAGWWRDRHGPQTMTVVAGLLAGGGYVGLAYANELWQVYFLYSLGAIGVGIVYTIAVNTAVKWFPDRRGLTTGAGTMAFAAGSALFVPYVRANATVSAFASVLENVGLLIGIGVIVGALVLRDPPDDWPNDTETPDKNKADLISDPSQTAQSTAMNPSVNRTPQYTWDEVVRTWQFWVMYAMFVGISGANLMLAANLIPFAENLGIAAFIATASATVLPIADGIGRLGVGGISDRIGRERSMIATFSLCGIGLFLLVGMGAIGSTLGFLGAVVIAASFEGTQYTLFPSVIGDYYGEEHSSTNYAILYSAKMVGGIFGGAAVSWIVGVTNWTTAFLIGGVLALIAGLGATVLRAPDTEA
ncbi:OFA family MFS transporter [Haladaptatus cibarius]|uniref:OFA family MFS transporter n=1 Tax=Haladaptatus cibarius TaxID=453847 RepID=UPI0006787756|nr:OFA family MFS transporter [Haladaptatus cibarius]